MRYLIQICTLQTVHMPCIYSFREFKKINPDISMKELAKKTKNFSGAEIEGLVRAAQSSAMNRLVKAGGKVQVDEDAIEKLMINPGDFDYALKNDVKPVTQLTNQFTFLHYLDFSPN